MTYIVTSDVPATADYRDKDGSSNAPVDGEWKKEVVMTGPLNIPNVSVVIDDFARPGTVSCEILVNGQSISKKTGDTSAYCSGNIPN